MRWSAGSGFANFTDEAHGFEVTLKSSCVYFHAILCCGSTAREGLQQVSFFVNEKPFDCPSTALSINYLRVTNKKDTAESPTLFGSRSKINDRLTVNRAPANLSN
jgi:hypothetical protein